MSFPAGTRLGPYEITAALGRGGMGEVYAARDTRLGRTVAIKVLPSSLHLDATARERFEREARAASALNHPHICALYDVGRHGQVDYLVMEFVEGETLATRLARGPLTFAQALACGADLAAALAAAHRNGIVHRDVKPANVVLTKAGPKLLDFGLARFDLPPTPLTTGDTTASPVTAHGTILGTVGYMAPEQAEGRQADARSDIWALGVVLYEMLTGQRAFSGSSPASVIGAILKDDVPAVSRAQPEAPVALDHLVHGALEREPDRRWQSAADVEKALRLIAATPPGEPAARHTRRQYAVAAGWLVAALVVGAWAYQRGSAPSVTTLPGGTLRFDVAPPAGTGFSMFGDVSGAWPIVSPDGTRLVFTAAEAGGAPRLYVRQLDSTEAHALPGTGRRDVPVLGPGQSPPRLLRGQSPDDDGARRRRASQVGRGRHESGAGGAWSAQGTILFTPAQVSGLMRINDDGTGLAAATTLDAAAGETSHRWPAFLPDGRHYVYTLRGREEAHGVYVGDLEGDAPRRLVAELTNAVVDPTGYLVFTRAGVLLAQPFDLTRQELTGVAVAVAPRIAFSPSYYNGAFSVSRTGVLAYGASVTPTQLQWMSRRGDVLSRVGPTGEYIHPRPSPDESKIAVARLDTHLSTYDVWLIDGSRGDTMTRLTFEAASERFPVWSPDGRQIAYSSQRVGGLSEILVKPAFGSDTEQVIVKRTGTDRLTNFSIDWSADGNTILFLGQGRQTNWDIAAVDVATGVATSFLQTPFVEVDPQLSADGRWLAYSSDESGRFETYLRPFPAGDGKWQVSSAGGRQPRWRGDGRELFYMALDGTLMAVPVAAGADPAPGLPVALFKMQVPELAPQFGRDYAASRDGQRFLVNWMAEQGVRATVVVNWTAGPNTQAARR